MHVSAKVDYALRAMVEPAAAAPSELVKAERLATAQSIRPKLRAAMRAVLEQTTIADIVDRASAR